MKDKKLTDQELINIFKRCFDGAADVCGSCPYKTGRYTCRLKNLNADILDLIHRLQVENAKLQKQIVREVRT